MTDQELKVISDSINSNFKSLFNQSVVQRTNPSATADQRTLEAYIQDHARKLSGENLSEDALNTVVEKLSNVFDIYASEFKGQAKQQREQLAKLMNDIQRERVTNNNADIIREYREQALEVSRQINEIEQAAENMANVYLTGTDRRKAAEEIEQHNARIMQQASNTLAKTLKEIDLSDLSESEKEEAREQARFDEKNFLRLNLKNPLERDKTSELKEGALSMLGGDGLKAIKDPLNDVFSDVLKKVPIPGLSKLVAAVEAISLVTNYMSQGISAAINLSNQYLSGINTRLIGLDEYQEGPYAIIQERLMAFAGSQYVNVSNLTKTIGDLSSKGIGYNLESRALLETIKDKLVTTFDTFGGQLDRIIRLQQSDLTRSQMGAEIELNTMLNSLFADTSYLNSLYDTVTEGLIDATSQMGYQDAVAFNFSVQKWLGSLYSLGLSSSAVSNILEGIANLSTGNIDKLNDSSIGNLFALSSRNAGISYTDALTNGLNASNINDLMREMIKYLKQISVTTSGNVAKTAIYNAIGGGMSYSDIRAIQNLSEAQMSSIYSNIQDYDSTQRTLNSMISTVDQRTSIKERIDNISQNALLAIGESLIGDASGTSDLITYLMWDIGDKIGGGVGAGLHTLVIGKSLLASIFDDNGIIQAIENILNNIVNEFFVGSGSIIQDFLNDMTEEINVRGQQYAAAQVGVATSGISLSSSIISNSYANDITEANLYNQSQRVSATSANITSGSATTLRDVNSLYAELFELQTTPIRVALAKLEPEALSELGIGPNGMLVDVNNNDVNSIISNVYTIRSNY